MAKTSFDGVARTITVNPGVSNISVKEDIYSAWKEWVLLADNSAFLPAIRTVGGESIGGSLRTGDLYFLMNGWKIVINELVNVEGALFHDDGIAPYDVQAGGGVISTVSQLVQTVEVGTGGTGSCPTTSEIATEVENRLNPSLSQLDEPISSRASSSEVSNGFSTIVNLLNLIDGKLTIIDDNVTNVEVDITQMFAIIETLKKFNFNRSKIDPLNKTLTIYDDDGTTPLVVFNLLDTAQQPSTDEVAEKVPV